MSSKKKKEERDKNVGVVVTPDSPDIKELIPNRVSEALWEQWSQWDELSESVAEVVNIIIERSWEDVDYNFKSRQLVPLTVSWAMREMLEVVQWNFLRRDTGDSAAALERAWGEEPEPLSCQTDAWTRGTVPVRNKPITTDDTARLHEAPTHQTTEETESLSADSSPLLNRVGIPPKPPVMPRTRDTSRVKTPSTSSRRANTPPHKHQLEIRTISESTSFPDPPRDTTLHSLLTQSTDQYIRTHRILAVPPKKLPANKVTPKVNVILPIPERVLETAKLRHSNTLASKHDSTLFSPIPEPLIEKIDPAPGVSIVQGDVIKRGPRAIWAVPQGLPLNSVLPLEPIEPSLLVGGLQHSMHSNLNKDVMT